MHYSSVTRIALTTFRRSERGAGKTTKAPQWGRTGARHLPRPGSLPIVAAALVLLLSIAQPAWSVRLVEVRVGDYPSRTRVVFELDSPAGYQVERRESSAGASEMVVTLDATTGTRDITSKSSLVERISLEETESDGSRARIRLRESDVRLKQMVLTDPARIVLDLLARGGGEAGAGTADEAGRVESTRIVAQLAETGRSPDAAQPPEGQGQDSAQSPEGEEPDAGQEPAATKAPDSPEPDAAEVADTPPEPESGGESSGGSEVAAAGAGPDRDLDDTGAGGPDEPDAPAPPAAAAPPASDQDGPRYGVSSFTPQYAQDHPEHPPLAEVTEIEVELGQVADGYVAPRDGIPTVQLRLSDAFAPPNNQFYASAIRTINQALVAEFNRRGLIGVLVVPSHEDIAPRTGEDLRPPTVTGLRLVIFTGRVKDIRTFASGERIPEDQRLDNPAHRRILERSPVKATRELDLMRKDRLDDYVERLNRHPGRRVDIQISRAREPGGAYLDYLVAELKPWIAYSQVSNTGTETTTKWRQRFGFTHNQLTGHDDILSLDYVTGNFDEVHALSGFYEAPIYRTDRFRWRVFGTWTQFDSTIFGFPGDLFNGSSWQVGGQLVANVFQHRQIFVDLIGGLRFASADIDNKLIGTEGEDDFFLPQWGIRAQRVADTNAVFATALFERNIPGVADTDLAELQNFGRGSQVDDDWLVMRWDSAAWFYLEPLIFGDAWNDPSTPFSSTLAHEVYLTFRGQYAFDNRLIPYEMQTLGGLYTIRGYEEAEVSGDSIGVVSVEYRFHIPRVFRPRKEPAQLPVIGDFRVRAQQVYGQPDWDLVLRPFFDIGRSWRSERTTLEHHETLIGTGVGVELVLMRNLSARFDYGWALRSTEDADKGDSRGMFVVRIQY